MANSINVNIVSPGGEIFSGEADSVLVPGSLGQMTILPKHAAILSSFCLLYTSPSPRDS